ncbi:hypothetical protein [Woodsholea maritima]|uniref:hypothetical protein n=1 Tax=Woodsholea maritima TaxID=240237 RepID=UPI000368107A|nr:hypothetical protein [Woodsholea maritima]
MKTLRYPYLILSLALSPLIAAVIATPLSLLLAFGYDNLVNPVVRSQLPHDFCEAINQLIAFLPDLGFALIAAIAITYILGSFPIVLAWWIAHTKGWRERHHLQVAMIIAGLTLVTAWTLLTQTPSAALIMALPAALGGLGVGTVISAWGYRRG